MDISISMYSLASIIRDEKWSIIDFLAYADSIAVNGVELLDIYWQEDKEKEITQVKAAMEKFNLKLSAYDVTNNFVKETSEERALEVMKVIEGIDIAKKLGADIVRVFCGDLHDGLTYEKGSAWIIEGLKVCAKFAEKEEIYLAIENHGLLAGTSAQVKEIILAVDSRYIKSTFDTGNFLLVHEKTDEAFNRLKEEIVHVHFKDFRKKVDSDSILGFRSVQGVELIGVIPGDGEVNLSYIVNGLKEINYGGWLSIEYEGLKDAKQANEEAVKRLRCLIE